MNHRGIKGKVVMKYHWLNFVFIGILFLCSVSMYLAGDAVVRDRMLDIAKIENCFSKDIDDFSKKYAPYESRDSSIKCAVLGMLLLASELIRAKCSKKSCAPESP